MRSYSAMSLEPTVLRMVATIPRTNFRSSRVSGSLCRPSRSCRMYSFRLLTSSMSTVAMAFPMPSTQRRASLTRELCRALRLMLTKWHSLSEGWFSISVAIFEYLYMRSSNWVQVGSRPMNFSMLWDLSIFHRCWYRRRESMWRLMLFTDFWMAWFRVSMNFRTALCWLTSQKNEKTIGSSSSPATCCFGVSMQVPRIQRMNGRLHSMRLRTMRPITLVTSFTGGCSTISGWTRLAEIRKSGLAPSVSMLSRVVIPRRTILFRASKTRPSQYP